GPRVLLRAQRRRRVRVVANGARREGDRQLTRTCCHSHRSLTIANSTRRQWSGTGCIRLDPLAVDADHPGARELPVLDARTVDPKPDIVARQHHRRLLLRDGPAGPERKPENEDNEGCSNPSVHVVTSWRDWTACVESWPEAKRGRRIRRAHEALA